MLAGSAEHPERQILRSRSFTLVWAFFATFRDSSVPYSAYGTGVPSLRVCRVILWLMWGGHPEFKIYSERARAVGAKTAEPTSFVECWILGLEPTLSGLGLSLGLGLRVSGCAVGALFHGYAIRLLRP